jgi:DNA modification methylase
MSRQRPTPETARLEIDHVPIGDVHPDPANPRRISDDELESLTRSIREFGLVDPVIARREDSTVIGGHQRLVAARRLGLETVPVIYVDLSPEQAKLLNLALNKISGDWDQELLARLLADLQATPDVDVTLSGFAEDEVAKLLKTLDARDRRERPEEFDFDAAWEEATKDPGVKRGDIWRLGDHRLMCGDSANSGDVSRLMAGLAVAVMVTDPPYGVAYEPEGRKRKRPIANDDLGKDQAEFWKKAFSAWPLEGDAYVFSPSGPLIQTLCASIVAAGIEHHQWLLWVKDRLVLGHSHYHYRHEHIFYGWKGKTSWQGSRKEDSVWEEERPQASPHHPTMKPVGLCVRAVENSSKTADVVVDPFLGSGTALIAAERTGRTCYGMEIDPRYCRVAISRWETFTGEGAELVHSGRGVA